MGRNDILVGIEVGTAKVCCAVAESGNDGDFTMLGVGYTESRGVRKGEVVDLELATECVRDAVAEAEANSDVDIKDVSVAVTGHHIQSFNSRGSIRIPEDRMEIDEEDLDEVSIKAREVNIPPENTFLHSIIQHYYVDGQEGIINPLGLSGHKLEADFHIVHGVKTRVQNTLRAIEEAGLGIEQVVVNSLASSHAILSKHQKELGAVVIDIGGGVTDWIVLSEGVVQQSGVLAVGGDHITNDISLGLRVPLSRADKLKIDEGGARLGEAMPGEKVTLKNDVGFSGKEIEKEQLNAIIYARVSEMFRLIARQVSEETPAHLLGSGIVLTGGTSHLKGIRETAEEAFGMEVHLADDTDGSGPKSILSNPAYSTAIGVTKFAQAMSSHQEESGGLAPLMRFFRGMIPGKSRRS